MNNPIFNDRIEQKYQLGIDPSEVADCWRILESLLAPYGLFPVQEITCVGSVYFDNKDCDLLRYSLLGRLLLFRVRAYEAYGQLPTPISEYWIEIKTAAGARRKKRRFPLSKRSLAEFLEGGDFGDWLLRSNEKPVRCAAEQEWTRGLYRQAQETLVTLGLRPVLMVIYKRLAFQSDVERVSLDWDVQYYPAAADTFNRDSWKYLVEKPLGRADKVILELKYLQGDVPRWFNELQHRIPIWRREYLKPVEGMGFLFKGPLKRHREAESFSRMIQAYMENSHPLR